MNRLFIINDSLENKISYYHIAAFLVALPFDRFYSELILISFLLHTLIHINRHRLRLVFTTPNLLLSSVFLVSAIGILYSQDKTQGLRDLERQLAILLFPLILSLSGLDLGKYKMNFLKLFSFTCVLTILYLYMDAIRIILYNKLPLSHLFSQVFLNHNFSNPIGIHATYLGMYCLFSTAIFLYLFLKEVRLSGRIVYMLCVSILLAGLLQLGSRSVLISAGIIAGLFPFLLLKGARRSSLILVITVTAVFITVIIININAFKTRYIAQFKHELVQPSMDSEVSEPRIVRWRLALQLIEKSPLYGYGTGAERQLLKEVYFNNKLYNSYLHELNAHNQYLSILLKTGMWGLLIFLFTLFTAFVIAFRKKDILFGSFLVIISIVSVSENILDVNKGIFFYAFFFSLFIHSGKPFERLFRFKSRQDNQGDSQPVNKRENAATVGSHNHL